MTSDMDLISVQSIYNIVLNILISKYQLDPVSNPPTLLFFHSVSLLGNGEEYVC